MTDEHEHAMKVWRDALQAGQQDWPKPIDDRAAAAVIAADRAGMVARIAELEECLRKIAAPRRDWETPAKHSEWCRYFARSALKDTHHD